MTIAHDHSDGALRIEVVLNSPTGRFDLRIVDEGPRTLTPQEKQTILTDALRSVMTRPEITGGQASASRIPVGSWGPLHHVEQGPGKWRSWATFRDTDDVARVVQAHASSRQRAETRLIAKLGARAHHELTATTRVSSLADVWLEEIQLEGRIVRQTVDRYTGCLRQTVLPAFGELLVNELTVGRLDRFLKTLAKAKPSQARNAKVVLKQMLSMAVRHGAITANPVREVGQLPRARRPINALTLDELSLIRAAIERRQHRRTTGPRRNGNLADIIELLLATGARIGEVLALRWQDIDLDDDCPTATICGTITFVKGQGFSRQDHPKTDAGFRTVILPGFIVDVLWRRYNDRAHPVRGQHSINAVFASRNDTWLSPYNVGRQWREVRKQAGLDWVTLHVFRKTVATVLDDAGKTKEASRQLGHASEEVTKAYYIAKPKLVPDVTDILNTLGPRQKSTT
ncbi:site-specific integrase [Actinoplanes sp. NPDC026670]|uniref:tyrosine-type recombinase/integrase n=1 Tax=Actinoplanes sp. NPDC026670 TaxID=3154700 RepID=UPI0033D8F0AD